MNGPGQNAASRETQFSLELNRLSKAREEMQVQISELEQRLCLVVRPTAQIPTQQTSGAVPKGIAGESLVPHAQSMSDLATAFEIMIAHLNELRTRIEV